MNDKYVVYVFADGSKYGVYQYGSYLFFYEPFYVGITNNLRRRTLTHITHALGYVDMIFPDKGYNKFKCNKIRKLIKEHKTIIVVEYAKDIDEELACNMEKSLIKAIGKRIDKNGILTNITDGGEGNLGLYGKLNPNYGVKWTDEQKRIAGENRKGKYIGKKNPNYNNSWTDKQKKDLSKKLKGKTAWNKGLIKDNDSRVLINIQNRNDTMKQLGLYAKQKRNLPIEDIVRDFEEDVSIRKIAQKYMAHHITIEKRIKDTIGEEMYFEIRRRKSIDKL